jgi:LPS O-antigen subunit length determinant protein (WzzB/FepE family)
MEREEFAAEEIDLRVYLQILQRWLWLIILCTLIAAISAYVISAEFMRRSTGLKLPSWSSPVVELLEPCSTKMFC